jgi:cell division protein FtsI/penicillin-binding protein 2
MIKSERQQRFIELLQNADFGKGKRGTQRAVNEALLKAGYEENKTITTFVGFAPADDAKLIMIVKLEDPKTSQYASTTAVPVWTDIFISIVNDIVSF